MPDEQSWDLVVVGGGISGMTAAVRAAERGLRAVVLEKGEDELYLCNSRYTGGAFHVAFHDIAEDADSLAQVITDVTRGYANPAIARAVAAETRQAVAWLRAQGVRFIKAGPDGWLQNFLAPPALQQPGLNWRGRGGDVMLRTLRARLEARGGALLRGWRARDLLMQAGSCAGVAAEQRDGKQQQFFAGATLLCDGGFQANLELLREYVSPAPEKLKQRGAATGAGDALQMARKAGAKLVGMENIYGHLLCQDAMRDDKLWPYPILDLIAGAGIVVDAAGKRFTDEGLGGVYMTNCIARLADPLSACVVYDRAIWDGPATEFILPANPHLVATGGTIVAGDTLDALAGKLGLQTQNLARTVGDYNAAVDAGASASLTPARTCEKTKPFPVRHPPFYAVRIAAGITYTMGGMATDEHARVLDAADAPIANLYAAGCTTGGLDGGQAAGYVSGLAKSAVMGLRAANHIADRHARPPGAAGAGGER